MCLGDFLENDDIVVLQVLENLINNNIDLIFR